MYTGGGRWNKVGGGGGSYTSSNGITLTGSNFKLGGTLVENTTINSGDKDVTWNNLGHYSYNLNPTKFWSAI